MGAIFRKEIREGSSVKVKDRPTNEMVISLKIKVV